MIFHNIHGKDHLRTAMNGDYQSCIVTTSGTPMWFITYVFGDSDALKFTDDFAGLPNAHRMHRDRA